MKSETERPDPKQRIAVSTDCRPAVDRKGAARNGGAGVPCITRLRTYQKPPTVSAAAPATNASIGRPLSIAADATRRTATGIALYFAPMQAPAARPTRIAVLLG